MGKRGTYRVGACEAILKLAARDAGVTTGDICEALKMKQQQASALVAHYVRGKNWLAPDPEVPLTGRYGTMKTYRLTPCGRARMNGEDQPAGIAIPPCELAPLLGYLPPTLTGRSRVFTIQDDDR
jgi:hypothetical protein